MKIVSWQGMGKENEMRYEVRMKPGETRALMQQHHLTPVLQSPIFCSDRKVQLGRYGYHLMSGLLLPNKLLTAEVRGENLLFPGKKIQNIEKQRTVFIRM